VFWFFLCISLTMLQMWQVANVAHGAGAIFGGLLGWCVVARSSKMRITSRVLFAVVLASVVLAAAVGRPYVNFSGIVADESGYLGYRALKDGDANQAVEYLETAVRLKPQDSGNWFNLGVAYYRLQRLDDAVAAYQRAIELSPDNADFKKALIQLKAYAADARRRSEGV